MALRKLGKYEIRSELGRGAMGVVYKAYDPILEREVALKTMMATMGALDGESKSRFYREARSAAKLTHRNIVTIYDMGEEQGIPFIAMEYLDGIDLHRKLKFGGPLPLREGLNIISQVLRGLNYAHQFEIVHRDIKPANIYILRNGTAKILDFGIAKLASSEMTRTGMVLGTVDYMSPEQIRADKAVDGRSDLFSAGVILYEFIAGRRPFPGETITSVMYRIVHEAPPELPADRDLPSSLRACVARALAKDPAQRYRTGEEFAGELDSIIREIDASIPTMRSAGTSGDSEERLKTARKLYDSGSFEDSAAVLKSVLETDPKNSEAADLMTVVERRAAGDATMILETEEPPAASGERNIDEILEEVEEEKRQTTAATGARSEAGARDLTLRIEDSDIGEQPAQPEPPDAAAPGAQATEILQAPPEAPAPIPPTTAMEMAAPAGTSAPSTGAPATSGHGTVAGAASGATTGPASGTPAGSGALPGAPTVIQAPEDTGAQRAVRPPPVPRAPVLPRPSRPDTSRGLSPAMLGVAALVIVAGAVGAWLFFRSGQETARPEAPAEAPAQTGAEEGATPAAAVARGYVAVDAQPWATVVKIRDVSSGNEVTPADAGAADATTPVVLELPEGTYEITLRHPEYGEVSIADVRVSAGQVTPVSRSMPGFTFESRVPPAP